MNREIKFRFWSKISKAMKTRKDSDADPYSPLPLNSPNYITMQFTGLQDSDGNDIYEGDIVKPQQNPKGPFLISYVEGCFVLEDPLGSKHGILLKWKPVKVLGNEFEDRELLDT